MRRITRQLDRDTPQIKPPRQLAARCEFFDRPHHDSSKVGEYICHVRISAADVFLLSGDVG
jgi:hypothetical protein